MFTFRYIYYNKEILPEKSQEIFTQITWHDFSVHGALGKSELMKGYRVWKINLLY